MGLRNWLGGAMTFVPPELTEDEWARDSVYDDPAFSRDTGEWRSGLRSVSLRPMEWTMVPPSRAGYWWVRRPGGTEQIVVHVNAGDEWGAGLEWSSAPVPEPRS